MIMFNRLPYFVFLQGRKYKINVDYRNMISFEKKILNKKIANEEKIEYGLKNFYPYFKHHYNELLQNPYLYKQACQKLIWFYTCGRDNYHKTKGRGKNGNKQIYSYEFDDEYIYGAFYDQYGIDLAYDKVHWWKFRALLKSLRDDAQFEKIKTYRAYNGDDKNMLELKKYWELPLPIEEQERLNKLYETLK